MRAFAMSAEWEAAAPSAGALGEGGSGAGAGLGERAGRAGGPGGGTRRGWRAGDAVGARRVQNSQGPESAGAAGAAEAPSTGEVSDPVGVVSMSCNTA